MTRCIVDFHVHVMDYERTTPTLEAFMADNFGSPEKYREAIETYRDPANFVSLMRAEGVDYSVILAENTPLTTGVADNDLILKFCSGRRELIPFCTINPHDEPDPRGALHRLHAEGFRGLKLYPTYNHFYLNDSKLYPIFEEACALRLPVLFHSGTSVFQNSRLKYGNPIFADDVAVDFPELTLIIAHGGRGPWYAEAMTMARLHRNVYIDLSGLPVRKLLQYFPELPRFAHKFLFGTDWPQAQPSRSLATYEKLGLAPESLDAILGGNARRILGGAAFAE